jgi:hypothetical protein
VANCIELAIYFQCLVQSLQDKIWELVIEDEMLIKACAWSQSMMQVAGWALAFVRYSSDYVDQEQEARLAKRGMRAGSFQPPWEWRRR